MAQPRNSLVDEALRRVSPAVAYEGAGTWKLSLGNGHPLPALARVTPGWLDVTVSLPDWALPDDEDDLRALQVNSRLWGPTRVARHFGERDPHLRAELGVERLPDVPSFLDAASAGVPRAVHLLASLREGLPLPPLEAHASPAAVAEVERACAETGWRVAAGDGLRVDLDTRAGGCVARYESTPQGAGQFVVALIDLSGRPEVCCRAVGALLAALSGAVRLVKAALVEREGASSVVLVSSLLDPSERSVDDALSALAVACRVSGREAEALLDERLASAYVAMSRGVRKENSHTSMEVATCLQ